MSIKRQKRLNEAPTGVCGYGPLDPICFFLTVTLHTQKVTISLDIAKRPCIVYNKMKRYIIAANRVKQSYLQAAVMLAVVNVSMTTIVLNLLT